ncbi:MULTISPECIES: septum site-determining protein MinC [Corallincola]|uniref:Probable septum site-determining protein MinC n=2 Tax=Corallincola TaxID=1775176 RepID=A0ABY1WVL7_9GAMM|nr:MULTISPECIES: septum site-determining protein MinC [Corallincola]TAA48606.1 septum site-determining protein MinC [Corallincola spongiicola]TCI05535.1 septum site-determining protein MinC [Corallincola luteus]
MSQTALELKGSAFTLSVLKLSSTEIDAIAAQLEQKIAQVPHFFDRAPIVVDLEMLAEQSIDFEALKSCLEQLRLVPVGVTNADDSQKLAAKAAGFASLTRPKSQTKQETKPAAAAPTTEKVAEPGRQETMVVRQPVRSGQQIYAKDCDLIVMGQVSNGAEVIADGNIHVYGTLRGRAIAGAKGDLDARIFCQNLQAELVSICGHYWLSDALQESHWQQATAIYLQDEKLTIDTLN